MAFTQFDRVPNHYAGDIIQRIKDFRIRLAEVKGDGDDAAAAIQACRDAFIHALDDDLNISGGIAAVFDFIRDINKLMEEDTLGEAGAAAAAALLDELDQVTGIFAPATEDEVPEAIWNQVLARQEARRNKDFAKSDEIRDALLADGWVIEDTPNGPRAKRN